MTAVANSLILLDEQGRAWVDGANTKVIEIAIDHTHFGWSAEQIHTEHPHLSLAQVYAALSYYYDHKSEFDAQIAAQVEDARKARERQGDDTPIHRRLRSAGKLR